jgi:hypothetical protein
MDASGQTGRQQLAGRVDTGRPDTRRLDRRTRTAEPLSGHHMVDVDRRQRPTAGRRLDALANSPAAPSSTSAR